MASCFHAALFFLLFPASTAFNITQILGQFSDFSNLNDLLTKTQVASEINRRQTITVLAVNNAALSSVSNQPTDVLKKVLSLHVVLDYFDRDKITKLSKKTAILTTLFQSSGLATGQNGFINVTDMGNGQIVLGSAAASSNLNSRFVNVLVTHPYNISVLHISNVIVPPSLGTSSGNTSSSSPSQAPRRAPGPSISAPRTAPAVPASEPSPSHNTPSPSDAASPQPVVVRSPAPAPTAPAPSDGAADSPEAPSPVVADGSPMGSPTGSPSGLADVPSTGTPADDSPSGTQHVGVGAGLVVALGAAFLVLF